MISMNDTTDQTNAPAASTDAQMAPAPMNQTAPVQTPSPEPQPETVSETPTVEPTVGAASTPEAVPQMENTEVSSPMPAPDAAAVGPTAQPGDVMPMGATSSPSDSANGSDSTSSA